jgi:indole-3-glycerol phosphate synthase
MTMLERLVDAAREGVAIRQRHMPAVELEKRLSARDRDRPFNEALVRPGLSLIAEFKRRSPTAGDIAVETDLVAQVGSYARGGAAAVSVLTEQPHFGGSLDDLSLARKTCDLPLLRKDFIVDPYQLIEAAVFGADAVLLIMAVLDDDDLRDLYGKTRDLDLDCIVEVRTEDELARALAADVDVIGINNRSFPDEGLVTLETTFRLMPDVPTGKTVVAESGISQQSELDELERVGVDAVLIGEALMRAEDAEGKTREFARLEQGVREHHLL